MTRLKLIVLVAAFTGAVFASTATAQARTWPAHCTSWKCVNAHLNALHANDQVANKKLANLAWVNVCFNTSFPVTEYPAYLYDDGASGFFDTTAVDYTNSGDGIDYWVIANTPGTCGSSVSNVKSGRVSMGGHSFAVGATRSLPHN